MPTKAEPNTKTTNITKIIFFILKTHIQSYIILCTQIFFFNFQLHTVFQKINNYCGLYAFNLEIKYNKNGTRNRIKVNY